MPNLKDDNRNIRLTSSVIDSPESKDHLILYSENTKRDIERLKSYINDVSVNSFKTLAYKGTFDKDGVEDGISGETVISLLNANGGDGEVFYESDSARSKTVYESLLALKEMIDLIEVPADSNAELAGNINDLSDKLQQLKNSTLGEEASFSPSFNPSLAQHLYELIVQCFNVVDDDGKLSSLEALYSGPEARGGYTAQFALNAQVSREGILACSDSFQNLDEELTSLYQKVAGTDCADFGFTYSEIDFCFITGEPITNIKELCESIGDKVCSLNATVVNHEDRISALETVGAVEVEDATEEVKGIVKIASETNIRGAAKTDNNNVALCLTPGSFLDFYQSITVTELQNESSPFASKFMSGFRKSLNVCSIDELEDVLITNPEEGNVLKWDGNQEKWIAGPDNTSLGSVTSVNDERGDVVLDATDIKTVGAFFQLTNPNVNVVLATIEALLNSLSDVAYSGLGSDLTIEHGEQNYETNDEDDLESHLAGIDIALGELNSQLNIGPATTENKGIVELATDVEVITGVDNERAVTSASLQNKLNYSNYFKFKNFINNNDLPEFPILGGSVFKVAQGSESFVFGGKTLKRNDVVIITDRVDSLNSLNFIQDQLKVVVIESTSTILDQISISWDDVLGKPAFGTAALLNAGSNAGQVPVIGNDGKLAQSIIPEISGTGGGSSSIEVFVHNLQTTGVSSYSYFDATFTISRSKNIKTKIIFNFAEGKHGFWRLAQSLNDCEIGKELEIVVGRESEEGSLFILGNFTNRSTQELCSRGGESLLYTKISATQWGVSKISEGHIYYENFKTVEEPHSFNSQTRTYDIYPSGFKNKIFLKSRGSAINVVYDLLAKDLSGKYSQSEETYKKEFVFIDSTGTNKTNSFIRYLSGNGSVITEAMASRTGDTFTLQCVGKVTSGTSAGRLMWRLLD